MAWDDILDAVDGRKYTHRGISGAIKVEDDPHGHGRRMYHAPDDEGRKSEPYLKEKSAMGDEWETLFSPDAEVRVALDILGAAKVDRLAEDRMPVTYITHVTTIGSNGPGKWYVVSAANATEAIDKSLVRAQEDQQHGPLSCWIASANATL